MYDEYDHTAITDGSSSSEVPTARPVHSRSASQTSQTAVELTLLDERIEQNQAQQRALRDQIAAMEEGAAGAAASASARSAAAATATATAAAAAASGGLRVTMQRPLHKQKSFATQGGGQHVPVFCLLVFLGCGAVMAVELWENGWKLEPFEVNPTFGPTAEVLLRLGAKRTDLIVDEGEGWRLLTAMWLHAGVVHFAFNMAGLYNVGVQQEREYGWRRIAPLYLASGLYATIFSGIFVPEVTSVGASGAIFGLFGAAWADLFQNWSLYRGQRFKAFLGLFLSTAFNLGLGLVPYLDNFAHIGGFLCGFLCGLVLLIGERVDFRGRIKDRKHYQNCLQVAAAVAVPIGILVSLSVLYLGIEADKWCSWCHYLSCVPSPYWDCSDCAAFGTHGEFPYGNNTLRVTCPGVGKFAHYNVASGSGEITSDDLLEICKAVC